MDKSKNKINKTEDSKHPKNVPVLRLSSYRHPGSSPSIGRCSDRYEDSMANDALQNIFSLQVKLKKRRKNIVHNFVSITAAFDQNQPTETNLFARLVLFK
jgi:hypothetical protein